MPIGQLTNTSGNISLITGSIWHNGTAAPDAALGNVLDYYLNTVTNEYYFKDCDGLWKLKGSFGAPLKCRTIVANIIADVALNVVHQEMPTEICSVQVFDQFNIRIEEIIITAPTSTSLSLRSNIDIFNIQIKLMGF